jgi:hypothetical protein
MSHHYYYAEAVVEDGYTKPVGEPPPCCRSLRYDKDAVPPRFVLRLLDPHDAPDPAWEAKTEAEIEADYPGILGGV